MPTDKERKTLRRRLAAANAIMDEFPKSLTSNLLQNGLAEKLATRLAVVALDAADKEEGK